jgi:nitroreductase
MDVKVAIAERRSIRKYKQESIPDDLIRELLEAARLAPSGTNHQPWRFIVVKDEVVKQKIQVAAFDQKHVGEAPVLLVCCADLMTYGRDTRTRIMELIDEGAMEPGAIETYPGLNESMDEEILKGYIPHAMLNVAIAMENIALRAVSLGLGTCIIQLMKTRKVAEILELPPKLIVTALISVGFPDESPRPRPRIALEDIILRVV